MAIYRNSVTFTVPHGDRLVQCQTVIDTRLILDREEAQRILRRRAAADLLGSVYPHQAAQIRVSGVEGSLRA